MNVPSFFHKYGSLQGYMQTVVRLAWNINFSTTESADNFKLEDFDGKSCAFVFRWMREGDLNKSSQNNLLKQ